MTTDRGASTQELVLDLAGSEAFRSELAQVRAYSLLNEMLSEPPALRWTYRPQRLVRNATALHEGLKALVDWTAGALDQGAMGAARLAAEAWESLANAGNGVGRSAALMNAAVQYEIAGYQANAACLARLAVDRRQWTSEATVEGAASAFLQRRLIRAILLSDELTREPSEPLDELSAFAAAAEALIAKAIASASRFLLSGEDDFVQDAHAQLELATEGLASAGLVRLSNLAANLRALLPLMHARSTWNQISGRVHDNWRWQRYLRVLARGLSRPVLDGRSISELWPSQIGAIEAGLLDADQSMVLRMPTSAGKTLVAQLAIVHTLITQPGSRCLYIAPYRALVNEVEEAFGNLFTDLGYAASSVLGTYEQDTIDELILLRDEVLVLTPEKVDLVLRLSPEVLDGVRLVVLDEGHIVGEGSRGAKYELLVTRLRHHLPSSRFLAMSAVVPDETLRDFALWLGADPQRSATTDWRPTIQRYAKLEWSGEVGTLRYAPGDQAAAEAAFVHGIVRQHRFEFVNPDTNRINRRRFPESGNRAEVAAALAYQVVSSGSVLIFCGQRGYAEAVGKALEARIALAEGQHESVPDVFNVSETRSHTVALEWLGEDHLATRLLRRGIGVHHGQLPEAVRTAIEDDVRDRRIQVVAATSTLAQGVNLPVRTVIFHTAARFDELSGTQKPISAREYWNIAGRAGRAGAETEGLVVHLVFGPRDERAFQYYLRRRSSVEPVDAQLFDLLDDLTRQRLSRDAVRTVLDSEILALLVEESTDDLGATTREMLNRSLFAVQARHRGYEPTILIDAIVDGMRSVAEEVQDPELRRVFSSTGLASVSCLAIRDHALQRSEQWAYLLRESSDRDRSELIDLLLDGLAGIEEMQPPSGYAGNYSSLLEKWLDAESMAQIARDLEIGDIEALAKFVESFCGYQLPWGIAGYIRIASAVCGAEASSPLIQHLPSMVKYGVPNRVAVWAMGTGIPSRELAVRIASAYLATSRFPSAADFSRWLGRFDPERLAADLNISGTLLEDTARAVIRSHRSDLLDRVEQGEPLLPREATIPVSSVAMGRGVVFDITEGTLLEISRDYESVVNRNSIRVSYRGVFIGYLPWELATMLAPEMDAGLGIVGIVRHAEFDVRAREIEIVLERI